MKISIPKPCHEHWDQMTPNEKGRFCGTCCKTVIDFTGMTPVEIVTFLTEQASKKICGRFTDQQLTTEYDADLQTATMHIVQSGWPVLKKMTAVFILIFALSQQMKAQHSTDALQPAAVTKFTGKVLAKPDPPQKTDTVPSVSPTECLTSRMGGITVTSTEKRKKSKKMRKSERQAQKKQKTEAALAGEVVVVGMAQQD
ncbi:hypothetical protein A8C56_07115 [Niabella ginsenosidivorans]|uniref:Uncharacterized protein n=1 Tax=Niabella ginsenosidivorans TaxID=1176587 RepID=A0A1A9I135_9BACT|nr:hypothetical protein [Niabella ginsenosidivorans]ANH80779.1 hypothetical protein A8C56_07115 [Niabella ginsenosidivorans]